MSAGRRPHHHHHHHQLESYENTDQFRHNLGNGIYPPPPPAAPLSDLRKTSGDPLRLQGRDSREEPETTNNKTSAEAFRHLLVGDQGEGASGDLLRRLEEAISRGDHKCAAGLAKELAKLKISSRLTEQEEQSEDRSRSQSQSQAQSASKKCSAPVKLVK